MELRYSQVEKMRVLMVVVLPCLLFLSGCTAFSNCRWEERSVTARGVIIENGAEIASADVTVGASRGSVLWKSLNRIVAGTSLKGHVTSITLVRSDDPTVVLLAIPVDDSFSSLISSGSLLQRPGDTGPDLGGLFEIVAANRGVIEITTDLPSRTHVSIPLTVNSQTDWTRPSNCY
jgi:hypothetical protein